MRGPNLRREGSAHKGGDDLVTVVIKLYLDRREALLKTPTANLGSNGSAQHPDKRKAGGHGPTLDDEICFLLNVSPDTMEVDGPHTPSEWWGPYAEAIRLWEEIIGVPAPVPVMSGPRGGLKINPRFPEWMMGLPKGWVTEVPDVGLNEQLARIGNGVVPMQAYAAFKLLMREEEF